MKNTDAAWRYMPVVSYLLKNKLRPKVILEIGSGTTGLAEYYEGQVLGIDRDFAKTADQKPKNMTHRVGMITKLPIKDNTQSVVVCLDTYEHLPAKDRKLALTELVRVLQPGGKLILGFPTGVWSAKAEAVIERQFQTNYDYPHPWLSEHRLFGLPNMELINQWLADKKVSAKIVDQISNVNLVVWWFYHWLFTVNIGRRWARWLERLTPVIYSIGCWPVPPFYRQILVIEKNET